MIKITGEIAEVRTKAQVAKNALETFALYVTHPEMGYELIGMRRHIEDMEKQIVADLREEARS